METLAPGTLIANRYQIAVPVGAGGMGVVYYAFDHGQDGLPIALKTFHPHLLSNRGTRDSFLQEGRAWLELGRHPHIVEAYAIDRVEGRGEVFIAAELISPVDGKRNASLRQWVQPGGMPWEQAFLFGLQIVWGMQHAMRVHPGLVHRDLKPENVLVGADKVAELDVQRVRVTDFGLAAGLTNAHIGQGEADIGEKLIPGRSVHGAGIAGTPAYMAPEQWLGEGLDERTDIYAWGLILTELLSGKMVVLGDTASEIKQQHLGGLSLTIPQHAPSKLSSLVEQCVAIGKASRPEGWEALEGQLRELWRAERGKELPEGGWRPIEDATTVRRRGLWAYIAIGLSYTDIGQYDHAVMNFKESLAIARELGDREVEGAALGNLGNVYESIGQHERALALYKLALAAFRELGDRAGEGGTLGNLGNVYESIGHYERALDHYGQRLAIARELGDRAGEAAALGNLGIVCFGTGEYEQALEHYEHMLNIARELDHRAGEGKALANMGNVYARTGQYERALAHHQQHLAIARELGDRAGEAAALGNLGSVYQNIGKFERALAHHEQHLAIARELGDRAGEGRALGSLGIVYRNIGQYDQALVHCEQDLMIARQLGDRAGEGAALGNLGAVLFTSGQYEQALVHYKQQLVIARELGDRAGEGRALGNLGLAYLSTGQYDQALTHFEQDLAIADELGDVSGCAITSLNLAVLTAQTGDLQRALAHAQEAQNIFVQIGQPQYEQQVADLIAQIKLDMAQS